MTRRNLILAGAGTLLWSSAHAQESRQESREPKAPAYEQVPELIGAPKDWINGKPLKLAELKGKVIVAFYWTFQ